MVVHRSIQLFDTRFMVKCLETSSGRKAWVKDGWKNVLSSTQAETTRGSEHSQQSAPPPKHNTAYCNIAILQCEAIAFEVLIRGNFAAPLIVAQADIKCDRNNYRN